MTSKVETIRRGIAQEGLGYYGLTGGAIVELDDRLLAHETRLRAIEGAARVAPAPDAGPQIGDEVEDEYGNRGIDCGVLSHGDRQMRRHDGMSGAGNDGAWVYVPGRAKILRRAAEIEAEKARDGRGGDATPTERAGDPTQATAVPGQVAAQPSPSPDPDAELVEELATVAREAFCSGGAELWDKREARAALALLRARGWGPPVAKVAPDPTPAVVLVKGDIVQDLTRGRSMRVDAVRDGEIGVQYHSDNWTHGGYSYWWPMSEFRLIWRDPPAPPKKAARKVRKLTDKDAEDVFDAIVRTKLNFQDNAATLNAVGFRRVR